MNPHDRPPHRGKQGGPGWQPPPQPPYQGGPPAGTSLNDQATMAAEAFARPPQPGPAPVGPYQSPPAGRGPAGPSTGGFTGPPPTYQQPPAPTSSPAPAPAAQPSSPKGSLGARIAEKRWWVLGGAVAAVAAVTAAVVLTTGQDGTADTAAETTSAATSVAGVPGLTEATSAEQSPSSPAPSTPPGTPAPPPPPPPPSGPVIAADALAPLLLPASEIAQTLGLPDMTAMAVESQPLGGTVTPPHCTGAWGPAYATTYNGTGYTGLSVQGVMRDQPVRVAQAVVAFPDPAAAKGVYDKLVADWNACQSTRIVFEVQGATNNVDVGRTVPIGDIMTLKIVPTDSPVPGQQCERGMALRGNVIVDVRTCSPTVGSSGYSITRAIADRVR
ncbi:hypothetical protein MARA_02720 (plasmid) [Mycolicibacterium arabiense]|uniref:PknH-like extracellular domain-containing protein n=1 Tax=Mycolicibacterium arabiense TaxID=1286181 RepID=A0A7I7RQJ9_9MYCO|nr:hypothetical protein MARA_02720 [Mycolicibacterium arabiense]